MTSEQRFERRLPDLLDELGMGPPPDYRDFIVQETASTRQRPVWTFPERWIPVDISMRRTSVAGINWRLIAVGVLVLLALVTAALFVAGSRSRLPAPPYGPAANGLIAYADRGDIYLVDPVTGVSRAIITGNSVDEFPGFSRDGTKLGFLRMAPFVGHYLMEANADGSDIRKITPGAFVALSGGDLTGDARYEVVVSEVDGRSTMSIIDISDGSVRTLDVGMIAVDPIFRPPDGREILFVSGEFDAQTMYLVDIDAGAPHPLRLGGGPRYSPDGSQIAYTILHPLGKTAQIESVTTHVMNADGSNDHQIAEGPGTWYQNPVEWSPDGTRVLLIREDRKQTRTLAVVPADGTGQGVEYEVPIVGDWGPTGWSPDGRYIYFAGDEATEAYLIDTVDGSMRSLPVFYTGAWQRLAP